jgi:hypothetical protein
MTPCSTPRDLILAVLCQREFTAIAPFVLSLKRTGYQGRLVVFTSKVSSETQNKLLELGVTVVPFDFSYRRERNLLAWLWPLWRWYFAANFSTASKIRLAHRFFHLRYRRYLLYSEFLQKHCAEYDRILLADATDVFFQADPFAWNISPGLHFMMEETGRLLGNCRLHRRWLSCQFGPAFLERHAHKDISCSGTTFGDVASIHAYLSRMIETMMRAKNLAKIVGGDQGIHNFLVLEKLLDNFTAHPNRAGPVLTMAVMNPRDVHTNPSGAVLNANGEIAPVLHQYDRHPELAARLLASLEHR